MRSEFVTTVRKRTDSQYARRLEQSAQLQEAMKRTLPAAIRIATKLSEFHILWTRRRAS